MEISPRKAPDLRCTLNNKAAGQAIPVISINGEGTQRTCSLRYLGVHINRIPTYKFTL